MGQEGSRVAVSIAAHLKKPLTEDTILLYNSLTKSMLNVNHKGDRLSSFLRSFLLFTFILQIREKRFSKHIENEHIEYVEIESLV